MLWLVTACSSDEGVTPKQEEQLTVKTNDVTGGFEYQDKLMFPMSDNAIEVFQNGEFQYEFEKIVVGGLNIEGTFGVSSSDYYLITPVKDTSGDWVRLYNFEEVETGVLRFYILTSDGREAFGIKYHASLEKCWWCLPAGHVIAMALEVLDDTQAEDCGDAAVAGCGAGNVKSFKSTEDGGLFGGDASCSYECKE